MAISVAAININPAGGSTAPAQRIGIGPLKSSLTSVTIGVAGDYSAGGAVLTPGQLGFDDAVMFGVCSVRTPGGAGTVVQAVLDCTSVTAPKLKANTAAAEAAAAGVAGAVIDVWALGY